MKIPEQATKVKVRTESGDYEGMILPTDTESLVIKLSNGYNIGINKGSIKSIEVLAKPPKKEAQKEQSVQEDNDKPTVHIIHTGGTIASKVDYSTGAVVSKSTPEEILSSVPELKDFANIQADILFQMFSEDFEPVHWSLLAKKVAEIIATGVKGVIVAMGTDTLEYVASALSFALQGCPVPVIVLGSQRSSDRPSSDASMNLICAARFICNTDFKGIAVCLHDRMDDKNCLIIEGHHVKKMHTSRRDTFRPVNRRPVARVDMDGKIEYIRKDYNKEGDKLVLREKFSSEAGLVKIYPGFKLGQLDWYAKNCKALVIEAYAFGQMPINRWDKNTEHHPKLLERLRELASSMPVIVVSQRPYGFSHMNVYSTSRDLLAAGLIEGKMQSHVAYVKLCWVLANYAPNEIKEALTGNLTGEIVERTEEGTFLI